MGHYIGDNLLAAAGSAGSILNLLIVLFVGISVGAGIVVSQYFGAKQGILLAIGTTAVITVLLMIFGRKRMGVFTTTEELVALSMRMLTILAGAYVMMAVIQSLSGIMRGAGDATTPMWIAFVIIVVIRVPVAYLLVYLTRSDAYPLGRYESIYISMIMAWVIVVAISIIFYKHGK